MDQGPAKYPLQHGVASQDLLLAVSLTNRWSKEMALLGKQGTTLDFD
jgi:hypothetical protein